MFILRKIFSSKVAIILLLLLTLLLFVGVSSLNSENCSISDNELKIINKAENISISILPENNDQICDSRTGICGPPPGWYKK